MDIVKLTEEVNAKADAKADALVAKVSGSKWTAIILLGAALVAMIFVAL